VTASLPVIVWIITTTSLIVSVVLIKLILVFFYRLFAFRGIDNLFYIVGQGLTF
jgi:hypothetical protein